jgi:hypothetical protein
METKEKENAGKNKDNASEKDFKFENELKARIQKEWGEKDVEKTFEQVKEVIQPENSRLLSVFSLDSGDHVQDIDVAILTALLKGTYFYFSFLVT